MAELPGAVTFSEASAVMFADLVRSFERRHLPAAKGLFGFRNNRGEKYQNPRFHLQFTPLAPAALLPRTGPSRLAMTFVTLHA